MADAPYPYEQFLRICYHSGRLYTFKQIHKMYLRTDRWLELQQARLALDGHRCRMCNRPATCVHHREYPAILGTETVEDLTSLCHECHHNHHTPPGVEEVMRQFMLALESGESANCPVCKRHAKFNIRSLNCTMARSLVWIVSTYEKRGDGKMISVPDAAPPWLLRTNQHTTLKHWGLLETCPSQDSTQKRSGLWRPTDLGADFVNGKVRVPHKICTWKDVKIGQTEETVSIQDCLTSGGYNYQDTMKSPDMEVAEIVKKVRIKSGNIKYDVQAMVTAAMSQGEEEPASQDESD